MSQYSDDEQTTLMKNGRCFSYKERDNIAYDCLKKAKIAAISKSVNKDNNSQGKE